MAAPFYSQGDQDIYASGNKFIPQEQYRLGPYTPPAIMGQNTNAGIVNTQAAGSYMGYPSYEAWLAAQGGGGGNGGGNDPVDNTNRGGVNQNLGPTNITDYESEAYGVGPTWAGSWARAKDAYSKLPTPTNLLMKGIRKWKENREIKRVEEKAAADKTAADAAANQVQQNIQKYKITGPGGQGGDRPNTGMNTPGGGPGQSPTGGDVEGTPFAYGGRIGYAYGDPVVPEDENEDIYKFMRDQDIPFGEQVEEGITEEQTAMILDMLQKGMDMETIISITGVGQEDIMTLIGGTSMAPDSADEGLASLV